MFVLSVLEAPNTKTNSLYVQTLWKQSFFLILKHLLVLFLLHLFFGGISVQKMSTSATYLITIQTQILGAQLYLKYISTFI